MARNFLFKSFHQEILLGCMSAKETCFKKDVKLNLYIKTKDKDQAYYFIPATVFQRKFLKAAI